jgi:hypothetical protein
MQNHDRILPETIALIQDLDLPVRRPTVRSWTRSGARKTIITIEAIKEYYPPVYAPSGIIGNLKFALRYEPIDLSVYDALFGILDAELLEAWIGQEPTRASGFVEHGFI